MAALVALEAELRRIVREPVGGNVVPLPLASSALNSFGSKLDDFLPGAGP
jgi:hypothetical protein